jgi:hypothetical protein
MYVCRCFYGEGVVATRHSLQGHKACTGPARVVEIAAVEGAAIGEVWFYQEGQASLR